MDEKRNENDLNDDPFLRSLLDKNSTLNEAINKEEKLIYKSDKARIKYLRELEDIKFEEIPVFHENDIRNKIQTELNEVKKEVKDIKSQLRLLNRLFIIDDYTIEELTTLTKEQSYYKKRLSKLRDQRKSLKAKIDETSGYSSPDEAYYSREELKENKATLEKILKYGKKGISLAGKASEFIVYSSLLPPIDKLPKVGRYAYRGYKFYKYFTKAITRIIKEEGKAGSAVKEASKEIIKLAKKKKIKAKITYKKDSFKVTKNVDLKGKLKKGKGGVVAAEENLVVGSDVVGRGKTVNNRVNKLKKIPKQYYNVPPKLRGKKPGTVDLSKFTEKLKRGRFKDPKTKYIIGPDKANHGGSIWKLFDKSGKNRIGSITKDGLFIKK